MTIHHARARFALVSALIFGAMFERGCGGAGADLSGQANSASSALRARRHHRLCRPHARAKAQRAARSAGRRGEPARRRRDRGDRRGREIGARRLYAGADGSRHRHQSDAAGGRPLRPVQELADRFDRELLARGAGRIPHIAGEDLLGAGGLRQGQSRQAQLRLGRHRHARRISPASCSSCAPASTRRMSRTGASARPTPT